MTDILELLSTWSVEDIGPQYGLFSPGEIAHLHAVNDGGIVVGSAVVEGSPEAFLVDHSSIKNIHPPGSSYSHAFGINKDGWISGTVRGQAYCRSPAGVMSVLGSPAGICWGHGISNAGQVVGMVYQGPSSPALSWGPPTPAAGAAPVVLASPGVNYAVADVVNSAGRIGGHVRTAAGAPKQAAFFESGQWTLLSTVPGGHVLTALGSEVRGINASGDLVGTDHSTDQFVYSFKAFVFRGGTLSVLPNTQTYLAVGANGISDEGEIAGTGFRWSQAKGHFEREAFIHSTSTGYATLESLVGVSGWRFYEAKAISPSGGVIVGTGQLNGESRFFRIARGVQRRTLLNVPDLPHAWPELILGGVRLDGPGIRIGPKGPSPVPPWQGFEARDTPGMAEVVRALALHELSRQLADASVKRELQPRLLAHAAELLGKMREIASRRDEFTRMPRERVPSKLVLGQDAR